jgi:hypothetical protein
MCAYSAAEHQTSWFIRTRWVENLNRHFRPSIIDQA